MAQKRRGLGRGLQALIPETQTETPSARPTDVFFPESQEPSEKNVDSLEGNGTGRTRMTAHNVARTTSQRHCWRRRSGREGRRRRVLHGDMRRGRTARSLAAVRRRKRLRDRRVLVPRRVFHVKHHRGGRLRNPGLAGTTLRPPERRRLPTPR